MIRRAALRSAAKVAFGASVCLVGSLSACAGRSTFVEADGDGNEPSTGGASAGSTFGTGSAPAAGSASDMPDAAVTPPELACTNLAAPGDAGDQVNCCSTFVVESAAGAAANGRGTDAGALAGEPSFLNCCQFLAEFAYFGIASDHCCFKGVLTREEESTPFCSPWGPPMPPALDAALEAQA